MPADETRNRLLLAAADAFAEFGYGGASVRKIQVSAGVNSATTHYHFGSKMALYEGVVRQSLEAIVAERLKRMARLSAEIAPHEQLIALIEAYMQPHLEIAGREDGRSYGRILARLLVEPRTPEMNALFAELVTPARRELVLRLGRLLPRADHTTLARCVGMIVSIMALAPFDSIFGMLTDARPEADRDALLTAPPRFAAAGILDVCGPLMS